MTTAEILRKIVALCGPVKMSDGFGLYNLSKSETHDDNFLTAADNILAHARRVLRENGIDVRWHPNNPTPCEDWFATGLGGLVADSPTEAECILAALVATQPKGKTPRFCSTSACDDLLPISDRGTLMRASRVAALLNAPHYTQADIDEAVAELQCQLEAMTARYEEAAKLLSGRAGKLLKNGKTFVVVAVDEPYFRKVFEMIRDEEILKGSWTQEDTDFMAQAVHEWADIKHGLNKTHA